MLYISGVVRAGLPAMLTPDMRQQPPEAQRWAADNGCYSNPAAYSDERYLAWLERMEPVRARCLFATAPDVWGDWSATIARAAPMLEPMRQLGYPVAMVAQDGLEAAQLPRGISAVFVGGSDAWRHSEAVPAIAAEARRRGLWVHIGRVNSWRRYEWARSIGAHSVDGTVLRFDPARPVASWPERAARQPMLGLE